MWFVINREEFLKILSPVSKVIPTKTPYPIIQNVYISVEDKKLICIGTDLDSYIKTWTEIEAEENKVLIPGKKLIEIVKEVKENEVSIGIEDNKFILQSGRSKFSIPLLDAGEFPDLLASPQGVALDINSTVLIKGYEKTKITVSKQLDRPSMTGILMDIRAEELRFVSTDGYRLSFYSVPGEFGTKTQLIISPKVFGFLPDGDYPVKFSYDDSKMEFSFSWMEIRSRLIEGPYPDYEKVIPSEVKNKLYVNRDGILSAIRRVMILSDEHTRRVKFKIAGEGVTLQASTPEGGEATEIVEGEYQGEPLEVIYNGRYLVEIINLIDSDRIVIGMNDSSSPGVVFGEGQEKSPMYLLMPIVME